MILSINVTRGLCRKYSKRKNNFLKILFLAKEHFICLWHHLAYEGLPLDPPDLTWNMALHIGVKVHMEEAATCWKPPPTGWPRYQMPGAGTSPQRANNSDMLFYRNPLSAYMFILSLIGQPLTGLPLANSTAGLDLCSQRRRTFPNP